MALIFINYRRDDSQGDARSLYEKLSGHFGQECVFLDLDGIPGGVNYQQALADARETCDVMLVLIGKHWLTLTNELGQRRIDFKDEWRLEIETVLRRGIPVIPVLLNGTLMPKPSDLPDELKALTHQQAMELAAKRYDYDMQLLIARLEQLIGKSTRLSTDLARLPFEPETVLIPAGPFLMGSDISKDPDAYNSERPQRERILPSYRIGKYPVTVGEYGSFIKADGYREPKWWTNAGWQARENEGWVTPYGWDNPKWTGNKRMPVLGVSWYEAVAYCQWLAEITGRLYHLPGEAEWEKAARGVDGRIYPWGNEWNKEWCNTLEYWGNDPRKSRVLPVGRLLEGNSSYGVVDIGGNVSEWCASKWLFEYVYPEDNTVDGDEPRAGRGSSWCGDRIGARVASRSRGEPNDRNVCVGFRVAMSLSE